MGGIVGIQRAARERVGPDEIQQLLQAVRHRGPDDSGLYQGPGVGLGHARLAIRDPGPRAAQPMSDPSGRYVLCLDGELYGSAALRAELESAGVSPGSHGDTALLLATLATKGLEATLPRLRGMWAFALWDEREETLVLARDPHGGKPLHYVERDGEVLFASETKALVQGGARVDAASLHAALLGWAGSYGERTLFEGVRAVRAGECVTLRGGRVAERRRAFRMADLADPALRGELDAEPDARILERVEAELARSVSAHMESDAPIAALVSGGVDSSVVASLAHREKEDLPLYHADVAHASERDAAERFAAILGRELVAVSISDPMILDNLVRATFYNETPLVYHPNSIPFLLVGERAARDGVRVLLTGEAADSYWLGSPFVVLQPFLDRARGGIEGVQNALHRVLPRVAGLLWPRRRDDLAEQLRRLSFRYFDDEAAAEARAAFAFVEPARARRLHVTTLVNVHQHLSTLVHRNDRMGAAAAIEPRHPFLDEDLAKLSINLPGRFKIRVTSRFHNPRHPFLVDKWCIRQIASRYVSDDLAFRPKKGFPVHLYNRLRIDPDVFDDGFVAEHFGLSRFALERVAAEASPLWRSHLMLAEVWGRLFVRGESQDAVRARLDGRVTIAS